MVDIKKACDKGQCKFNVKTENTGKNLDCVDIFKHPQDPDNYYGVFHEIHKEQILNYIYLAMSEDGLTNWQQIVTLQGYASQGKVWVNPKGNDILLAYESTAEYDMNRI